MECRANGTFPALVRPGHRYGRPFQLGAPAGVVTKRLGRSQDVELLCNANRLALVQRLHFGELVGVLLEQFRELPHHLRALGWRPVTPGLRLERLAGRIYGSIDVLLVRLVDFADDFAGCRVFDGARFSIDR